MTRAARMNGKPMDLSHHVIKKTEREEDKIPQLGVADLFDSELWMMTVSMAMVMVGMEIKMMGMMTIEYGMIVLCQILTVTSSSQ